MNILDYIEELIAQGYTEEQADAMFNTDQGCYDMEDDFSF